MSISYVVYKSEPHLTEALLIERMLKLDIKTSYDIRVYPDYWYLTLDNQVEAIKLDNYKPSS